MEARLLLADIVSLNPYESPQAEEVASRTSPMPLPAQVAVVCSILSTSLLAIHLARDVLLDQFEPAILVVVAVSLLILASLFQRFRLILSWSRVVAAMIAIGAMNWLEHWGFVVLMIRVSSLPPFEIYLGLTYSIALAALGWSYCFSLGFQSARIYFGLACPKCGEESSWLADFHSRPAGCEKCDPVR